MTGILVVGEDILTCSLGEKLVSHALPGWSLARPAINTNGVTKLIASIPRYCAFAQNVGPVLCVADADRKCAVELRSEWLPPAVPSNFVLRIAVAEAESWILADRSAVAGFFGVALKVVPPDPDALPDPKAAVLALARRSRHRTLRDEMVSATSPQRKGPGYNVHLSAFLRQSWDASRALEGSESLARAVTRVSTLGH